ncbi:uncharacterized protein LOC143034769 [Oratosquilla oratoria]|uniref:uncharacterized protein LOC143034769 n=1 Tax=Oratosquilla oratoria TaxID=337810 RepID=UPI003F766366
MGFIDIYRSEPSIWRIKSKEYSDRQKKAAAYERLAKKLREVEPEADRETVVKKINNIRSTYRRELKKVVSSKKSGCGAEDVYTPRLWYFNLLQFLSDQELPSHSVSTLDDSPIQEVEISECEADSRPVTPKTSLEASTSCQTNEPTLVSNCTESGALTKSKKPQRKRKVDQTDAVLSLIGEHFKSSRPEDYFDIMGKNFATTLRHVAKDQRLYAVKLMNDVLFEAQLGNLNRHWTLSKPNKLLEGAFPQPEYLPQNSSLTTDVMSQSLSASEYFSSFYPM